MARLLFLPIILSLFWIAFLHFNNVPLAQGKRGFIWIIGVSGALIALLSLAIWLTA
ncbi:MULTISPECIES: hypothetical protein [Shewanella]|jgi:hypothetical protein|uniref:Uncharacterized protein n=3 Tax=Bacteria TaxID=2 RepID=A0A380BFC7_9GAMM|nr:MULTISPECIES: hypothetical protein [Shewanella]EKT4487657.1 hypothetical protein [Shewanella algae]MBC8797249.1 hypothetical protein [Shewanella algae]MBO2548642.1 hypothetical protein [Shewanella algae]MBO2553271.1 hypothetical protein [Shewanella algae]MBO2557512.1 hypothetical protein [Shewanella algae]